MNYFHDRSRDQRDNRHKGPQLKQADKDYYRKLEEARQPKPRKEVPLFAANMDEQKRDIKKADRRNNLVRKHNDSAWWHKRDSHRKEKAND